MSDTHNMLQYENNSIHSKILYFVLYLNYFCFSKLYPNPNPTHLHNSVPSHIEMHERSIFPFLRLCLSFEMNCSTPRSRSDWISRRIRASTAVLVYVVINNSSYPSVKNNSKVYHAFGKYWMQARGLLNYRLKCCWPKVIHCICLGLSDGRYFSGLASILLLI